MRLQEELCAMETGPRLELVSYEHKSGIDKCKTIFKDFLGVNEGGEDPGLRPGILN